MGSRKSFRKWQDRMNAEGWRDRRSILKPEVCTTCEKTFDFNWLICRDHRGLGWKDSRDVCDECFQGMLEDKALEIVDAFKAAIMVNTFDVYVDKWISERGFGFVQVSMGANPLSKHAWKMNEKIFMHVSSITNRESVKDFKLGLVGEKFTINIERTVKGYAVKNAIHIPKPLK